MCSKYVPLPSYVGQLCPSMGTNVPRFGAPFGCIILSLARDPRGTIAMDYTNSTPLDFGPHEFDPLGL